MAITSVHCRVLGGRVARVTDLEDRALKVICPEFEPATSSCRLKKQSHKGGPLSELLERMSEDMPRAGSDRCDLM
jgi:hypothetical protein